MKHRPILICLGIAAFGHSLVFWLWPARMAAPAKPRGVLELELTRVQAARPMEAVLTEQAPAVEPLEPAADEPARTIPEVAEAVPAEPVRSRSGVVTQPLNLARPEMWPESPAANEADAMLQTFRPALSAAVAKRREAQARGGLQGARRVARNGMDVDAYNAIERVRSNHMKTAMGCFTLENDVVGKTIGPSGMEQRWWRSRCKDRTSDPLQLPALEYDAVGRVVGP